MGERDHVDTPPDRAAELLALTAEQVRAAREAVFPHHGLVP